MAKRKSSRRGNAFTLPLAVVAGFVPAGMDVLSAYRVAGVNGALGHVSLCTTGYDPADGKWKPVFAAQKLYLPLLAGVIAHKLAGKLGVNRMLARMGIPVIRI